MDRRELLAVFGTAVPLLSGLSPARLEAITRSARGRHAFLHLDQHQAALATQVAELIIPATDTPGAREAGVGQFIDVIVGEWYTPAERESFLLGLADLDARSRAVFGRPFLESDERQQTAVLTGMEAEARAMPPGSPPHFFSRIKGLTISGYYTSELAFNRELGGQLIPGTYDGCAAL